MVLSFIIYFLIFIISSIACRQYEVLDDRVYSADYKHAPGLKLRISSVGLKKIFWMLMILIPPVFISTFRGLDVGKDTANYLGIYQYNKTYSLFEYLKIYGTYGHEYEIGYQQLLHLAYVLRGGYNLVKTLSAFLIIVFVWRGALYYHRKFEINSGLCMFFFYLLEFTDGLNIVRFSIALAIFFYAFRFVIEKNILKYSISCFAMMLFHSSMIVAAVFYVINFTGYKAFKKNLKYIMVVLTIIIALLLRPVVGQLLPLIFRNFIRFSASGYTVDTTAEYGAGLYLFLTLPLLPLLKWGLLVSKKVEWQVVLIAILSYVPFRLIGYFGSALIRFSRMPEILFCVLYCGVINKSSDKPKKYFWTAYLLVLTIGYYIINIKSRGGVYPFVFDFTNYI